MEVVDRIWTTCIWLWEYPFVQALLGTYAAWLIAKAVGRSNKSIKWLRITYKDGIEKITRNCMDSEYYLKLTKLRAFVLMFGVLLFMMIWVKGTGSKIFDIFIPLMILLGFFGAFKYLEVVKKVYLRKHREYLHSNNEKQEPPTK